MTAHRTLVATAVVAALAGTPLGAQERAVPTVGDQVRIASPVTAPGTIRGELVEVRGDTLVVRRDDTLRRVAVPLSQLHWMEVRRPRSGWQGLGRGLLYGVPIGFGGGYVLGVLSEKSYESCGDDCGLLPAFGAAAGLVAGTVLGAVIGVGRPGGRWVEVPRRPAAGSGGVVLSIGIEL